MIAVFYGAYAAGFLVAGAFFLKFWSRTREPLLVIFAAAFALIGVSYGLIGTNQPLDEEQNWIYFIRLTAFVLIIIGIAWTNLRKR